MSFDVHLQGFHHGGAGTTGGVAMRRALEPHIVREEVEHNYLAIEFGDGQAEIYLRDDGMMATHISGSDPWDLLVRGARAAGWVILIGGLPTCLTDASQLGHLPPELVDNVRLVESGADHLRVVRS